MGGSHNSMLVYHLLQSIHVVRYWIQNVPSLPDYIPLPDNFLGESSFGIVWEWFVPPLTSQ